MVTVMNAKYFETFHLARQKGADIIIIPIANYEDVLSKEVKLLESWIYLILYFLVLNVLGYLIIWHDKKKSLKGQWRVPEARFFVVALIGGALGVYFGMKTFRHKTQHLSFKYGIPLLVATNIVLFGVILYRL